MGSTLIFLCLLGQAEMPDQLKNIHLTIAELPVGKTIRAYKEAMIVDSNGKAWLNGKYVVTYNDPAGRYMELQILHGKSGYFVRIIPLQETKISLSGPNLLYFSYPSWKRAEKPGKHYIAVQAVTTEPLPKADPDPPSRRTKFEFVEPEIKKPTPRPVRKKYTSPGDRSLNWLNWLEVK